MEGVNKDTVRGKLFELLINNINSGIALLNEYGAQIVDESNPDYYIKQIRYSPAEDAVLAEFVEIGHV